MMEAARQRYRTLEIDAGKYWLTLAVLGAAIGVGLMAAYYMEHHGHWVTGMSNQIVWGMPHVFAILLIVAASGALNVASMGSVFGEARYKPLSRISGLIAVALLVGGLLILVLDLGRPDRLIVAMTTYNFKSIFAWNIFLYTGFVVIAVVYLWMLFEPRMGRFSSRVGILAFVWRIVLTTGTGSIFGFLVARNAYDAAIMAPLFVAMSLSVGTALFMLITCAVLRMNNEDIAAEWLLRLRRLNGIFVAAVLYFTIVQIVAGMYVAEHGEIVRFILSDGGAITGIFWIGQILIGSVLPMILFFHPRLAEMRWIMTAAMLVVIGAVAHLYVIIIGGQAVPMELFPGKTELSSFYDGVVAGYGPSVPELLLGLGGIAVSLFLIVVALRVLPFLPAAPAPQKSPR
jgi:molybdopterin-containing oxidoreductase family membrane subunit